MRFIRDVADFFCVVGLLLLPWALFLGVVLFFSMLIECSTPHPSGGDHAVTHTDGVYVAPGAPWRRL